MQTARRSRRRALVHMAVAVGASFAGGRSQVHAAQGNPVLAGKVNDAGDGLTRLVSSGLDGTLELENRKDRAALRITDPGLQEDLGSLEAGPGWMKLTNGQLYSDAIGVAIYARSPGTALVADGRGKEPAVMAIGRNRTLAFQASSQSANGKYGTAMYLQGKARFESSDRALVPAGRGAHTIKLRGRLAGPWSYVLATVQDDAGIGVLNARVIDEEHVRLTLTDVTPRQITVGYLVLEGSGNL